MGDVISLGDYRIKRAKHPTDMLAAGCMHCGDEFPWGERFDHRCEKASRLKHPSTK